jgi:4-hydroxy-3-methylbut-2-enyl diphosphate reductase
MAPIVDVVIVVGSPNSSNSNRLREVAINRGTPSYMVDRADQLDPAWIAGKRHVGVTAGASAPEVLVEQVIDACRKRFDVTVEEVAVTREDVQFKLPRALSAA